MQLGCSREKQDQGVTSLLFCSLGWHAWIGRECLFEYHHSLLLQYLPPKKQKRAQSIETVHNFILPLPTAQKKQLQPSQPTRGQEGCFWKGAVPCSWEQAVEKVGERGGAGGRGGEHGPPPRPAPVHTFAHINTPAGTHAELQPSRETQRGSSTWLHSHANPGNRPRTTRVPRHPGSLPLATVYPGGTLILRGNWHCCFYVPRMRASVHCPSADLPCTPRERIPPFFLLSPLPLQAAGSFIRDAQLPEGRWQLKRATRFGFFPLRSWKRCRQPGAVFALLPPSPASAPVRGEEERGRWKELWSPDV